VKGPFTKVIPRDLEKQASLARLGYRSVLERLGERFHVSPALLQQMIEPDVTIQVTREDSALRVSRPDGTLVFFAPVTTGSEHDPLPIGDWKVTSVHWYPVFHYNPKLFWDASPKQPRAEIKRGPNNPVGIVWIDINREHYGLHGSPEPSRIGHTESHGCVRMTNWDAARVASFVKPGTPVLFR
jgi:lipoprotein-anchoring transpeptidase ErfK/SrfK